MFGLFLFWISQFKDVFTKRLFFIRIFRVLNTVQSFIFKVQSVACSHQQLVHYIRAVWFCQALFLKFFRSVSASLLLNSNFGSLSYLVVFVNNFFTLFFQTLYQQFALEWKKESFGIERRKRDLNPRAGCPTYTLSRGASSASWVFLLSPIQGLYLTVCLHTFNVTSQRIDNYT